MEPYPLPMVSQNELTSRSRQYSSAGQRRRTYCILVFLAASWLVILAALVGLTVYSNTGSADFSFPVYLVIVWAIAPPLLLQFWKRRSTVFNIGTIKRRKERTPMPEFDSLFKLASPSKGELCPICLGDMDDSVVSKTDLEDGNDTSKNSSDQCNVVESVYCYHKFDKECARVYIEHWGPTAVGAKGDVIRCPVCRASWAPEVNPDEEIGSDGNSLYYYASSNEGSENGSSNRA
ncbi:hypothetical protein FOL47_004243 [Perkinsus chesapeaki]|uniref:RING-type domain-containing protein n=1 Tax=Perkinsus chesapeaki TaxID=330153 RepID=A0A7J6M4P7_PERCH|nr:hypothetical protein FOL47_004243 [Perkinsus chesapeaki]